MNKLETVQKTNNLNEVFVTDKPHAKNNGHHTYEVHTGSSGERIAMIRFQNGPRNETGSVSGVLDGDLLEIVKHRMESFQNGPYKSEYNEKVIFHVTQALEAMNERQLERDSRGVLGTNKV